MTAVFCHSAADRKADTWAEQLGRFDRLECREKPDLNATSQ